MAAVNLIWIRYEEKKLASIFGEDFKSYKERVRKWM
jgi:protein-S-isoprenylcysteine O-methyltransferase Ste14